jgi:hypothetical protein
MRSSTQMPLLGFRVNRERDLIELDIYPRKNLK